MTEVNVKAAPADDTNPLRNAFLMEETLLRNEKDAQLSLDLASSRRWGVFNPSATNTLAQPAGYLLVPGDNSVPYLGEDSPVRRRAGFINHHGDERDEGGFQARAGGFLLEEPGARRAATAPIAFARTSSGITPTIA